MLLFARMYVVDSIPVDVDKNEHMKEELGETEIWLKPLHLYNSIIYTPICLSWLLLVQ